MMITILFTAVFQFALWVGGIYLAYRILFYKSIKNRKELKSKKENAEKLSLMILKSSSSKEVQKFMKENVSYLSKSTFDKLNEHLDYLNLLNDEPLKARFEELESVEENLMEETELIRNKV